MANDAVVIDLMKMTAVRVDPEKKLAYIQAGADGGDVDHETALHNLICITGSVSHTGFAGVALGGGLGHLSRWLGPVVDSIVGYEMVTAAGKVVRVDDAKDPELYLGHARERRQLRHRHRVRRETPRHAQRWNHPWRTDPVAGGQGERA